MRRDARIKWVVHVKVTIRRFHQQHTPLSQWTKPKCRYKNYMVKLRNCDIHGWGSPSCHVNAALNKTDNIKQCHLTVLETL